MRSFLTSFFVAALLFVPDMLFGQTLYEEIPSGQAKLFWHERPLERSDFRLRKSPSKNNEYSSSQFLWGFGTEKIKGNNLIYDAYVIDHWFDRNVAWAVKDNFTDNHLRYYQLCFDLSELYRRKAQNGMNRASLENIADSLKYFRSVMDGYMDEVRTETDRGENEGALEEYEAQVKELLDKTEIVESVPVIGDYEAGFGYYANVTQSVFLTNVSPIRFTNPTGLNLGMSFLSKKSVYFFEVSAKFGRLADDYDYLSLHFPKGSDVELCSMSLGYARRVLSTTWLDVLPFGMAGLSTLNMFDNTVEKEEKHSPDYGLSLSAGADFRFKFYRRLRRSTTLFSEYADSAIYGKLYLSREQHSDFGGILTLNFGLGIDIYAGPRIFNQ